MGLPQSDLFPLPKSFQTAASSHTRRVLPSLRLRPQIRHSAAQRSRATKTQAKLQRPSPHLRGEGRLGSCGHLGGGWLSVLGAPQSAPTVMAPLGYQALRDLGPSQKQLLSISPSTIHRRLKPKKRQLKKRLYGRTKPGTLLKHQIPIKTDSWNLKNPRLHRNRSGLALGATLLREDFIHSLNVTDIHSTWVESRAVMGKSQIAVLNAMQEIEQAKLKSKLGLLLGISVF